MPVETEIRPKATGSKANPDDGALSGQTATVGTTLAEKLANVAREVDRVAKRGRNREQGYQFATASDIFDEIRGKLGEQRIALRWSIDREHTVLEAVESKGGAKGLFATLWITYTFVDGDNGTEFAYYTVGTANDYPGDKAVYKAQTNALKYLITQTFLVSTGDDVENDHAASDQQGATYTPRSRPSASAPASPSNGGTAAKMSPVEQGRINRLNESLPTPQQPFIMTALLRDLPYDKALAAMTNRHHEQCGSNPECAHVTNPGAA